MIPTAQLGQFGRGIYGGGASRWRTLIDWTTDTTGNNTGWSGYTIRQRYQSAAGADYLGLGSGGTKVRIQLRGGQTTGLSISKAYVGVRAASGDAYDFDTTPTQIFWGGSASVSVGALTNTAVSDEANLTFDGTKDLIFAMYFNSTSNLLDYFDQGPQGAGGNVNYYALGDSAATVNDSSGRLTTTGYAISKIEIYA